MTQLNGLFFIHPEGSSWIAAKFSDGELVDTVYEADAGTHQAANDSWAWIVPGEDDLEVDADPGDEIVGLVLGEDTDRSMVTVTRSA